MLIPSYLHHLLIQVVFFFMDQNTFFIFPGAIIKILIQFINVHKNMYIQQLQLFTCIFAYFFINSVAFTIHQKQLFTTILQLFFSNSCIGSNAVVSVVFGHGIQQYNYFTFYCLKILKKIQKIRK